MNLLLDTHVLLWFATDDPKLPADVARQLEAPTTTCWVSPVSVWEALLLAERGRIVGPAPFADWLRAELASGPFREAPMTWAVAVESRRISLPHEDPADRFLAATARVQGLTLVTADDRLTSLADVDVLAVRARKR